MGFPWCKCYFENFKLLLRLQSTCSVCRASYWTPIRKSWITMCFWEFPSYKTGRSTCSHSFLGFSLTIWYVVKKNKNKRARLHERKDQPGSTVTWGRSQDARRRLTDQFGFIFIIRLWGKYFFCKIQKLVALWYHLGYIYFGNEDRLPATRTHRDVQSGSRIRQWPHCKWGNVGSHGHAKSINLKGGKSIKYDKKNPWKTNHGVNESEGKSITTKEK